MKNNQKEIIMAFDDPEFQKETCRHCRHRERWQPDGSTKVFQYCGIRHSRRTANGLLKIKVTTPSCCYFEKKITSK